MDSRAGTEIPKEAQLLKVIRETYNWKPERHKTPPTEYEMEAILQEYMQREAKGLRLCEQFLRQYPDGDRIDEVKFYHIRFLQWLNRTGESKNMTEAFLDEHPDSEYVPKVRLLILHQFKRDEKFNEALTELDKIEKEGYMDKYEAYQEKARIYSQLGEGAKAEEHRLLAEESVLGKPAPDFSLKDVHGKTVSLESLRGKVVMLAFWATSCESYIRELPQLKSLYEKYKGSKDFILVSFSQDEDEETVSKFVKENRMFWIQTLDIDGRRTGVASKYHVWVLPHYVLIDRNGLIRDRNLRDCAQIDNVISSLLAEEVDDASKTKVAKLHQLRGDAYYQRGEEDKALIEYEEALRIQPQHHIDFCMIVARMYEKRGEMEKLLGLLDKTFVQLTSLANSEGKDDLDIAYTAYELAEKY